jgi:hypothetical protein
MSTPLAIAAVAALAAAAELSRRGSRNKRHFTVKTPKQGLDLIESKVYTDNWRKALKVQPRHDVAVLVPCAGTKPFSEAPSHKHGYMPALEGLAVDRWVVAEPLGVVPWSWEQTWPNDAYDYPPSMLKGAARDLLVERIQAWFRGPGQKYRRIFLALPGHHGKLVRDATKGMELPLVDVSISACRDRACSQRSFRATSQEYRDWLRSQVRSGSRNRQGVVAPSEQEPASAAFESGYCGDELNLYHVTLVEKLPSILEDGLRPGTSKEMSSFGRMRKWSWGRVFFSASLEDLDFWYDIIMESDAGMNSAWKPVVLKVPEPYVEEHLYDDLFIDDQGEDRLCTVFTYETIPADALLVDMSAKASSGWGNPISESERDWAPLTMGAIRKLASQLSMDGTRPLNPHLAPRRTKRFASMQQARAQFQARRQQWKRTEADFAQWAEELDGKRPDSLKPRGYVDDGQPVVEYSDLKSLLELDRMVD